MRIALPLAVMFALVVPALADDAANTTDPVTSSAMLSADITARIARSVRYENTWNDVWCTDSSFAIQ